MAAQWPASSQDTSNDSNDRNGGFKGNSGFSSSTPQRDKVYVQNIPLTMQEDSVEALFGKCGHVIEIKLLPAKDGRNTVAGFVKYTTEEAAQEAINQMSGCVIGDGPPLRVMWPANSSRSRSSNTQTDERRRGGGNRQDYDEGQGQVQGRNYSNGPSQQTSSSRERQPMMNNSYSPKSEPNTYGNQNARQGSFKSLLGRGEKRSMNSPKPPGGLQNYRESRQQSNDYPPLAPLKTSPSYPNSVSQQDGYREMPAVQGYSQVPQAQQCQQEMPSTNSQQLQPAQGYQEEPLNNGHLHQVPEQQQYHYQEHQPPAPQRHQQQQSTDGFQQGNHFQAQQFNDSFQQGQHFQQPSVLYQQQSGPEQRYHFQQQHQPMYEQPPAPAHFQEQPPVQNFPDPQAANQRYTQSNQQCNSWGDSVQDGQTDDGSFRSPVQNQSSWQPREEPRSFGRDKTCHNCKQPGHFSRECPNLRTQGGQTCHRCGDTGHLARECPTSTGPSGDQLCHKCGDAGHFARECTNSPSRGGDLCHKCGEAGHFARECTNSSSRGRGRDSTRAGPVTYIPQELPEDMDELFQDMPHSGINFDKYDNIPVKTSGHQGQQAPPPVNTFEEVNFGSQTKMNIRRAGFVKPTPVQKHAFPIAMSGLDLMACAQTGSGKTVAFLLPTLTSIINNGIPPTSRSPLVIVMAPTRELVMQIYKEAKKFADGTPVNVAVAYGGVSVAYQAQQFDHGCHFLAATPGRLQDFVSREKVFLDGVKYLILDEADRMLDLGFGPAIRKLVQECNMTPREQRQTLMFSATFPNELQRLAADFLKQDYIFLAVGCVGGTNLDIEQHVMQVNGNDKRKKLFDILNESGTDRTLVFVELKRVADFLACLLSENNFPTTSISSDRSQQEREAALRDFRNGRANILVATSVAARGLDIPDVKHVINYDLPQEIDEYVHRIGRTGRIGNKGKATSFFEQGRDEKLARSMVKVLSEAFQDVPTWLEQAAEDAVGSSYGPAGGRFASKDHRQGGGRGRRKDDEQHINNAMSNLNIRNDPSSNFGSQSYRQNNQTAGYASSTTQDGTAYNLPPQGSSQGVPPQGGRSRGTAGDSDDDWD